MCKLLTDATLGEIVAELQRRNPDQIIDVSIGTTQSAGSVPASRREEYERQVKRDHRAAAINLGFATCKACQEKIQHAEVCGCGTKRLDPTGCHRRETERRIARRRAGRRPRP